MEMIELVKQWSLNSKIKQICLSLETEMKYCFRGIHSKSFLQLSLFNILNLIAFD
jgi:hypothetical protein